MCGSGLGIQMILFLIEVAGMFEVVQTKEN